MNGALGTNIIWVGGAKHVMLKLGDIFDLPDNIGFEELDVDASGNSNCGEEFVEMTVIRLSVKEEVKPLPVETQEELFRQVIEIFNREHQKYGRPDYIELKSKFTITRNENI
jgi:hypothetical protein